MSGQRLQIHDKFTVAAVGHLFPELLKSVAFKNEPLPFHLDQDGAVSDSNENGRRSGHESEIRLRCAMLALRRFDAKPPGIVQARGRRRMNWYAPAIRYSVPKERLIQCNDPPIFDQHRAPRRYRPIFQIIIAEDVEL